MVSEAAGQGVGAGEPISLEVDGATKGSVRSPLLGRTTEELEELMRELGEPAYRGRQLAQWMYRRGAHRIEEMTDLPVGLRQRLAEAAVVGRSELVTAQTSRDGTS